MYYDIREEELKNKVAQDYFGDFDNTKIIGNIDFCITLKLGKKQAELLETQSILWAEAKRDISDNLSSLTQLILTIGKARTFDRFLPPKFLGCFDCEKIAFIPYSDIADIFYINDFNWNIKPSDYDTKEFKLIHDKVKAIIERNSFVFSFDDEKDLQEFIAHNFVVGASDITKLHIDKNNFMIVYNKWLTEVKPSIAVDWDLAKKGGIIDGDFYLADLLSSENETLKEKLYVLLKENKYELDRELDATGFLSSKTADFLDNQKAHTQFWNKYERPPRQEYWDYIVERRDLLVPQDIRERKGSFFTPQIWVEKSQEYIAEVLGESWQEDYFVWDCAAGTGNLLAGLTNKYNIYASTLDKQDVDVIHDRIENGANLLKEHCFQFDFLNDDFDKLPQSLKDIINDPEKRKKLVIYINPPYAEATTTTTITGTGSNKSGVTKGASKCHLEYKPLIKQATNEIFALFMTRVYREISDCHLAQFSKLKFINGSNFKAFKEVFKAKFKKGFIVPADTFDNVKGSFPIGFTIWDLSDKKPIDKVSCNVFDKDGNKQGKKKFYGDLPKSINKWIKLFINNNDVIALISMYPPDFQNNARFSILIKAQERYCYDINKNNLLASSIYLSVRNCIKATWLNDRDQFLYPTDGWKKDTEFQNDCLAFTLFHGQNRITSKEGANHWIPFTEQEVNASTRFESHFMSDFIHGKLKPEKSETKQNEMKGFTNAINTFIPTKPLELSNQAQDVFNAGLELWKYYHLQKNINVNASLYDIKEHFQGRNAQGRMRSKSDDTHYMELIKDLRAKLNTLAIEKIQPKVYEYKFLLR